MKIYEGKLTATNAPIKVGIVVARFNEFITGKLLTGALDTLKRHDVKEEDIEVAWVIAQAALETGVPVMFGIVTTDTVEQAENRAGVKAGNKGSSCAEGAIEMVNLIRSMEE